MSEKATPRISLSKFGTPSTGDKTAPPQKVALAAGALLLAAIASVVAAASLFGAKDWLYSTAVTANNKLKAKDQKTTADLVHQVNITPSGQLIQTGILAAALVFIALAVYRGKYWSRWAVLGLWVLATFVGTIPGFVTSVVGVTSSSPIIFKAPAFIAGVAFVAAVILTSMRPSVAYFNRNRPARPGGATGRRGLFASRASIMSPPASKAGTGSTKTSLVKTNEPAAAAAGRTPDHPDRSRSKARANTDAVAKGADLARSRAKASKSRRTAS